MRPVTWAPARSRPHLPGSWEGGSNLILVRKGRPGTEIVDHRKAVLARRPERRVMSFVTTGGGLCVANLHASTGERSGDDVLKAARLAVEWAADRPLVLGGDFNLRPRSSAVFSQLSGEFGFSDPTGSDAIDHLLVRGANLLEPIASWSPERRDVPDQKTGLKVRLSDHSPVCCRISA